VAGSAAAAAAALAPIAPALAHAPQAGKQAQPSFYRFKLGTIEITVVSDGTLAFPAETLWGDRADDARGLLTSTFQPSSPVGLQINTILVNTGDKLALIDASCGADMDVPLATKSRMAFLDRAAADKTLVGSYHLPFPGFGHVVREGSGYRSRPADWQWTS
jgi:hypothetical protein